jgi:RNA-directed DNA polymerase
MGMARPGNCRARLGPAKQLRLHQRGRAWGFAQLYRSPNQLGLISLNGIVVAPRPNRAWRVKPNTAGEERR